MAARPTDGAGRAMTSGEICIEGSTKQHAYQVSGARNLTFSLSHPDLRRQIPSALRALIA
jgi:hypothetical protein